MTQTSFSLTRRQALAGLGATTALTLGGCAAVRAIPTTRFLVLRDASALLGASVLLVFLLRDNLLGRGDGLLMIPLLAVYLVYLIRRGVPGAVPEDLEIAARPARALDFMLMLFALGCVIGGAHLLVQSASSLARSARRQRCRRMWRPARLRTTEGRRRDRRGARPSQRPRRCSTALSCP